MSGGGGSSSDGGGGGNQHASAKAAMTGNAAYSGSTKPSQPPGGGSTSRGSGRDFASILGGSGIKPSVPQQSGALRCIGAIESIPFWWGLEERTPLCTERSRYFEGNQGKL